MSEVKTAQEILSEKVSASRELISKAIEERVKEGWVIARHITYNNHLHKCCAIGAYYNNPIEMGTCATTMGADNKLVQLGWTQKDFNSFVHGFDYLESHKSLAAMVVRYTEEKDNFFQLGVELAKKYVVQDDPEST